VNSLLRVVESSSLHSFNRRFGIASGPTAFPVGRRLRRLSTSCCWTCVSTSNGVGYIVPLMSLRSAGFGSGKKWAASAAAFISLLSCRCPSWSCIARNWGSCSLWLAFSLAHFATFQILVGSSVISRTAPRQALFLSLLICFPFACEDARYASRLSSVLS
jgi:hypothetical protein